MGTPLFVEGQVSIARLHGAACWHCGAVTRQLKPAGTVIRPGSPNRWPIVSCGCRPTPTTTHRTNARRACTYCPEPDADTCVRTHPDGQHIYAHRRCAEDRGDTILYSSVEPPARPGETP
jgi:hypothetical protein